MTTSIPTLKSLVLSLLSGCEASVGELLNVVMISAELVITVMLLRSGSNCSDTSSDKSIDS